MTKLLYTRDLLAELQAQGIHCGSLVELESLAALILANLRAHRQLVLDEVLALKAFPKARSISVKKIESLKLGIIFPPNSKFPSDAGKVKNNGSL